MKLSRNKIDKLLKSRNQSRKNRQVKYGKSKSLSAVDNKSKLFDDDELILLNKNKELIWFILSNHLVNR